MIRALMRAIYYLTILALIVLGVWAYSTAQTWKEIAEAADKTQGKAAKAAKEAMDRADRCFSELRETSQPKKKPGDA